MLRSSERAAGSSPWSRRHRDLKEREPGPARDLILKLENVAISPVEGFGPEMSSRPAYRSNWGRHSDTVAGSAAHSLRPHGATPRALPIIRKSSDLFFKLK